MWSPVDGKEPWVSASLASRLSLDGSDAKTQTTIKIKVRWGLCSFGMTGWNHE